MTFKPKKITLALLALVSLVISRVLFSTVNDPEGPNLLIVVVLASAIYIVLLAIYKFVVFYKNGKDANQKNS
jgi:hypothetical protein